MPEQFRYEERLAFCQAMANIIAADRKVTGEERAKLEELVSGTGLDPLDEEVTKTLESELANPGSLTEILNRIETRTLRSAVFRMLIEAACADGEIAAEERAKILEAAKVFGLDAGAADEYVDWVIDALRLEKREQEILARLG